MKCMELPEFGPENLRLVERPNPVPKAGEVLVRLHAASLNFRDLIVMAGKYPTCKVPIIPCSDGAGVVAAIGDGVSRVAVGDAVCPTFYSDWAGGEPSRAALMSALGGEHDGCLAQYIVVPEQGVAHTPKGYSHAQAACLPCAATTAWTALTSENRLKAGDVLVVQGTGGVATWAIKFGKALGARVIVTSSSDAKIQKARALGADDAINYANRPDWGAQVKALTDGRGADQVIELGGGSTLAQSLEAIRIGGHVSIIGILSGFEASIHVGQILFNHARIHGITVGNLQDFEAMVRAIEAHNIVPEIDSHYPMEQAAAAVAAMRKAEHIGKIVIDIP